MDAAQDAIVDLRAAGAVQQPVGAPPVQAAARREGSLACCMAESAAPAELLRLPPVVLPAGKPAGLLHSSSAESMAPHTPAGDDSSDALARVPSAAELAGPAADAGSSRSSSGDSSDGSGSRFAYVTLLTRDTYLPGVQALARSLAAVQAAHPLLVLYTPDTLSPAALAALQREAGCQPLAVQRYHPPGHHDAGRYKLQLYAECWTKLRMWQLEQYERLVYLDADMVVLRNIDSLFALPPGFYAAPDCAAGRETAAERDACPLFCPDQPSYFNAGMFVMTPCSTELALFGSLLAAGVAPIGGYAEQDFLNWQFKGVWRTLPPTFNAQRGIRRHHPQLWEALWPQVAVVHLTDGKPWQEGHPDNERDPDLVALWWRAFEGWSQLLPAREAAAAAMPAAAETALTAQPGPAASSMLPAWWRGAAAGSRAAAGGRDAIGRQRQGRERFVSK